MSTIWVFSSKRPATCVIEKIEKATKKKKIGTARTDFKHDINNSDEI